MEDSTGITASEVLKRQKERLKLFSEALEKMSLEERVALFCLLRKQYLGFFYGPTLGDPGEKK